MSASGQCPTPSPLTACQSAEAVNTAGSALLPPTSQKSSTMRHMLALAFKLTASATCIAPGDRLSTIERPVLSMALRIACTSGWWYSNGIRVVLDHVVDLHEVDPPRGVLRENRVVPGLARRRDRRGAVDAPHVRVPWTRIAGVAGRGRGRGWGRSHNGRIGRDRLARNAAHDVDAEVQPHRVDLVRQWLQPERSGRSRRWKLRGRRQQAPVGVDVLLGSNQR